MGWRLASVIKRLLDVGVSAVLLTLLLPLMLLTAALVRWRLGSPVLFRQARPGRGCRSFTIVKFRTMTDERDRQGRLLPDAERLPRLGRALRSTSLDELPEMWNIIRGDMSLVGPRPLLERYTPFLTDEERARFEVRPGITGWAQVNGRNDTPWDQRLAFDAWYVRNWSLALDFKILAMTLVRVVRRNGVVVDPSSVLRDLDHERSSAVG